MGFRVTERDGNTKGNATKEIQIVISSTNSGSISVKQMIVERTNILSKLVMKKNEPEPYGISAYEKITNNLGLDIGIEQTDTWDSTSTVNQQNMKALRTMLDP